MILAHVSSVSSFIWATLRTMPAMFTAPSSLPWSKTVFSIQEFTCLLFVTSTTALVCLSPERDLMASSRPPWLVSQSERVAPREASSLAVANPIPLAPPVIAIWSVQRDSHWGRWITEYEFVETKSRGSPREERLHIPLFLRTMPLSSRVVVLSQRNAEYALVNGVGCANRLSRFVWWMIILLKEVPLAPAHRTCVICMSLLTTHHH